MPNEVFDLRKLFVADDLVGRAPYFGQNCFNKAELGGICDEYRAIRHIL